MLSSSLLIRSDFYTLLILILLLHFVSAFTIPFRGNYCVRTFHSVRPNVHAPLCTQQYARTVVYIPLYTHHCVRFPPQWTAATSECVFQADGCHPPSSINASINPLSHRSMHQTRLSRRFLNSTYPMDEILTYLLPISISSNPTPNLLQPNLSYSTLI